MFSNKDVIVDKNSNNLEFLLSFSVTAAQHKQNAKRKSLQKRCIQKFLPQTAFLKKHGFSKSSLTAKLFVAYY